MARCETHVGDLTSRHTSRARQLKPSRAHHSSPLDIWPLPAHLLQLRVTPNQRHGAEDEKDKRVCRHHHETVPRRECTSWRSLVAG